MIDNHKKLCNWNTHLDTRLATKKNLGLKIFCKCCIKKPAAEVEGRKKECGARDWVPSLKFQNQWNFMRKNREPLKRKSGKIFTRFRVCVLRFGWRKSRQHSSLNVWMYALKVLNFSSVQVSSSPSYHFYEILLNGKTFTLLMRLEASSNVQV